MCLFVIVRVPQEERSVLASAVAALPTGALQANLQSEPSRVLRGQSVAWDAVVHISEEGSCACSLLGDDADPDVPTWTMLPELREPLARTLEHLAAKAPAGAVVEALWTGDKALVEEAVTPSMLAMLARTDALGTRTRYLVTGAG